jgi:DNA-binding MarR family transcriptional regulator
MDRIDVVKNPPKTAKSGSADAHATPTPLAGALMFEDFVASKIITLATLIRRASTLRFQRMFGLVLIEWRLLIRLGASGPLSSNQLAAHVGIGKSQSSRAVTKLVVRGLVTRVRHPENPREVELALTPEGRKIHLAIVEAGVMRNQELIAGISQRELMKVNEVLTVLTEHGRALLLHEQEITTDGTSPSDAALAL